MGEYYGRGQYVVNYAGQFNTYLDTYNQFLGASFGSNQTLLNEFTLSTIAVAPGYSKSGGSKAGCKRQNSWLSCGFLLYLDGCGSGNKPAKSGRRSAGCIDH